MEDDPMVTIVPPGPGWWQFGLSAVGTTIILVVCWYISSLLIQQTNLNPGPVKDLTTGLVKGDQDQKHNINQTLLARDFSPPESTGGFLGNATRWLPQRTDGVVAPLWPWIAARLATGEHEYNSSQVTPEDRLLFVKGKWLNVIIVMIFLWSLGLVMARTFRPAAAMTVLLLGGLGALVPRAVYFQPETLYFILFFLTWVCAVKLLMKNDILLHALFGLLGGMAYLAKTSIEPLVLGWFVVAGMRFLGGLFQKEDPLDERRWNGRNHFIGLIVFAFAWLAVTAPRYMAAEERWGDARFSYPGAWMWMENYDDCYRWMGNHGNKAALDAIPPAKRPGLMNYYQTHGIDAMRERLVKGTTEKVTRWLSPKIVKPPKSSSTFSGWRVLLDRRGIYLGSVAAITLALTLLVWSRRKSADRVGLRLPSGSWAAILFTGGTVLGYALLYGWYDPIGRGERFMLALYLPLVFCLIWASERLMTLALMRRAPQWTALIYQGCLWALNGAIAWRLATILKNPVFDPATM